MTDFSGIKPQVEIWNTGKYMRWVKHEPNATHTNPAVVPLCDWKTGRCERIEKRQLG